MTLTPRTAAFWRDVAAHPAVARTLLGADPEDVALIATTPPAIALAAEHGGFILQPRDAFGRVLELHTMFTPEGWGREAASAAKEMFTTVFADADMVVTYENVNDWRARPPLSFGFRPCGGEFERMGETWRTWSLSADAWRTSPAFIRWSKSCLS